MGASSTLAERFNSVGDRGGPGVEVIGPVVQRLVSEVGLALVLGERDPKLPFARARGMMRIPADLLDEPVDRAFNGLTAIVSHFLRALPGATRAMDEFARESLQSAAKVTLRLKATLVAGVRDVEVERQFGGLTLLIYTSHASVEATTSVSP
jgi:hypothetical protein